MPRRVFDRVYGEVHLSDLTSDLLNCREVQRLDSVRQLGGCSFVYPSATHSRLEHSIGVAHLAAQMGRHLMKVSDVVTEHDVQCLEIAGLLHDVGHGPFSHLFEEYVHECIDPNWSHEWMSNLIIRRVLMGRMSNEAVELVLLMVSGLHPTKQVSHIITNNRRFLLDVVHNCTCGIDVDRLDYLMRDSLSVFGATHSIDVTRIVNSARAIPSTDGTETILAFDQGVSISIEQIFDLRTRLHRQLYQHRDVLLIEDFIKDSLRGKDDHFRASLANVDSFLMLTDASVMHSMSKDEVARLYTHPRATRVPFYDNSIDVRPRCLSCGAYTDVEDLYCGQCGCTLGDNRNFAVQVVDGESIRVPVSATVRSADISKLMCAIYKRDDIRVLLSDVQIGTPRVRNGWTTFGILSAVVFCDRRGTRVNIAEQMARACYHQRSVYCFVCAINVDQNTLSMMASTLEGIVENVDGKKCVDSCQHHGEYDLHGNDSTNQM